MYTTDVHYLHFCQHHYIHHSKYKYNAGMCANLFKCLSALLKIILTIMMLARKKEFFQNHHHGNLREIENQNIYIFSTIHTCTSS